VSLSTRRPHARPARPHTPASRPRCLAIWPPGHPLLCCLLCRLPIPSFIRLIALLNYLPSFLATHYPLVCLIALLLPLVCLTQRTGLDHKDTVADPWHVRTCFVVACWLWVAVVTTVSGEFRRSTPSTHRIVIVEGRTVTISLLGDNLKGAGSLAAAGYQILVGTVGKLVCRDGTWLSSLCDVTVSLTSPPTHVLTDIVSTLRHAVGTNGSYVRLTVEPDGSTAGILTLPRAGAYTLAVDMTTGLLKVRLALVSIE